MSIDTNNGASTRTVVDWDWDDAPEGATHFQPSSGLFRVDRWFKDDFTSVFVPSIGNCWIDCEDDDLGSLADVIERPKPLTQAVFDGLPSKYRWASVSNNGTGAARVYCGKPFLLDGNEQWMNLLNDDWCLVGDGYDTTNWQNSLIERQDDLAAKAKEISDRHPFAIDQSTQRKHSHYFKDVSGVDQIDVYHVAKLYEINDPALFHAFKKIACAGKRGAKDQAQDVQEAIDALKRWQELNK